MSKLTESEIRSLMNRLDAAGSRREAISPNDAAMLEGMSDEQLWALRESVNSERWNVFHLLAYYHSDAFQVVVARLNDNQLRALREIKTSGAWNVFHLLARYHSEVFLTVVARFSDDQLWALRESVTPESLNVFHLLVCISRDAFQVVVSRFSDDRFRALGNIKCKTGETVFDFLLRMPFEELCQLLLRFDISKLKIILGSSLYVARQLYVYILSYGPMKEGEQGYSEKVSLLLYVVLDIGGKKDVPSYYFRLFVFNKKMLKDAYELMPDEEKEKAMSIFSDRDSLFFNVINSWGGKETRHFFHAEAKKYRLYQPTLLERAKASIINGFFVNKGDAPEEGRELQDMTGRSREGYSDSESDSEESLGL